MHTLLKKKHLTVNTVNGENNGPEASIDDDGYDGPLKKQSYKMGWATGGNWFWEHIA